MFGRVLALRLVSLAALAGLTAAQATTTPTLYRLDAPASFEEGCLPPCLCPIWLTDDLLGTFALRYDHSDPAGFDHYVVDNVNWVVGGGGGGTARRVTGSGTYRVGGQFAVQHQLQLDLSTDGDPAIAFDSGLIQGGGSFPALDISIAQNGFYCYDRVFNVASSPVPAGQVTPYGLRNSHYQEGCLPPCACPIFQRRALGRFGLLDLGPTSDPTVHHYALVDVAWSTPPPAPATQRFKGFGIYSLNTGTATHRLVCDLTDGNALTQRFDSGVVAGGSSFPPLIDISVAVNGFYCYDQVFVIRAKP